MNRKTLLISLLFILAAGLFSPVLAISDVTIDELQTNWNTYENLTVRFNGTIAIPPEDVTYQYTWVEDNGYGIQLAINDTLFNISSYSVGDRFEVVGYAWVSAYNYNQNSRRVAVGDFSTYDTNSTDHSMTFIQSDYPLPEPFYVTNISDYTSTAYYGLFMRSDDLRLTSKIDIGTFHLATFNDVGEEQNITTIVFDAVTDITSYPLGTLIDGSGFVFNYINPQLIFSSLSMTYTIGDGVCDGATNPTFYFGSNQGWTAYNETNPVFTEYVDNSYHPDINGTAWHIVSSGGVDEGNSIEVWLSDYGYNVTVPFNISSITFKLYNVSMNMFGVDMYVYDWDYDDAGQSYSWYFNNPYLSNSDFILSINEDEYDLTFFHTLNSIEGWDDSECWRQWNNGTVIEGYAGSCPVEFRNIDWFFINIPFPYYNPQSLEWDYDMVIDDMYVSEGIEDESNSPDCALPVGSINELWTGDYNRKYVNMTSIILNNEAHVDFAKNLYVRGTNDYSKSLFTGDYSSYNILRLPVICLDYLQNKSGALSSHLVRIVGKANTMDFIKIETPYMEIGDCFEFIDLGLTELPDYLVVPEYLMDANLTMGDSYVLTKYIEYETDRANYYRYRYHNETHWELFNMLTNEPIYYEGNETRISDIGEYDFYRTVFYPTPHYSIYASGIPFPDAFTTGAVYDMILLADGYSNQDDHWGTTYTGISYVFDWNIIGDGICGSLESAVSSSWNFDSACVTPGLNVGSLFDGVGNIFGIFNESTSLLGNAILAANTEYTEEFGQIVTLVLVGIAITGTLSLIALVWGGGLSAAGGAIAGVFGRLGKL